MIGNMKKENSLRRKEKGKFKNLCILLSDATTKSFPKPITLAKGNFIFNNVV